MSIGMILTIVGYLGLIGYLGFRGFSTTKSATDYMLGGRSVHPYVMAMSYGATFISTSAIVGFGGAAGVFGMGLLWLTVMNIFIGIFIAFWIFGGRTRKMGLRLDAHTFPELLGRRFQSRFIQGAAAVIIFLFIPLYASAVLTGAVQYIALQLSMNFNVALFAFSAIIAVYVIMGGIKGVMYTDALQGTIMLLGMTALLVFTYSNMGGVVKAHQTLSDMSPIVTQYEPAAAPAVVIPSEQMSELELAAAQTAKLRGAVLTKFKKGGHQGWTSMPTFGSPLWWQLVSTIVMGVGIGVLAQPQLAVRYMTVKSGKELNRAIPIGGVFIMMMTGVAFIVGSLANVYFHETTGEIALVATGGSVERIVPEFIKGTMPEWFSVLFMLTLISAAMSTLSSQFHVMGTSVGRDFVEESLGKKKGGAGILATRFGVLIGILIAVFLSYIIEQQFGATGTAIVARGTAIFFGLCACAFLPMYIGALWSRSITKAGAIAGMLVGSVSSLFWLMFVQEKTSSAMLLCAKFFGTKSLAIQDDVFVSAGPVIWAFVDPILIGLPLALVVTVGVSLFTKKTAADHLNFCLGTKK